MENLPAFSAAESRPQTPPSAHPAVDGHATHLDRFLSLGLLNVYGLGGRMSRRVRADVAFAGMLILVQGAMDLLAWFLGMKLVFVNGFGPWVGFPLALVFACLFAATIAIFERSVLTADVGLRGLWRQPAIWFRMMFVLLASLVTAVPLELFLFQDEISAVVGRAHAAQVGHARDVLYADVDGRVRALDEKLDRDLARAEQQFAPLRAYDPPKVTSVSPRMALLEQQVERVTEAMQKEDEGVRSGAAGRGKRYRSLEGQLQTLNQQLALLTGTHNEELAQLRSEARTRAEAGEALHQQAVKSLREGYDKDRSRLFKERADIDALSDEVLAHRARVTIDVADGFSARLRILSALSLQEESVEWGIWALRLVMVLFGLLVLIQKVTFSTETRAYFSSLVQAAQGDAALRGMFGALLQVGEISRAQEPGARALWKDRNIN